MLSDRLFPSNVYCLSHGQELILQATLLKGETALQAWDRWQSAVDIETLDSPSAALLSQLYQNLLALGVQHQHMARLKGIYRRNWYANQLQLNYLSSLLAQLKNHKIEAIVLGQASFCSGSVENYRSINNFHLLVQQSELERAVHHLIGLNWQLISSIAKPWVHLQDQRQFPLYLQAHLFWCEPQDYTDAQLWHYATPYGCDPTGWQLSVTDQFLDRCARTFFKSPSNQIEGIADAMLLIQNSSQDLDWRRLIAQAQRYQMVLPVRNMLILLREVLQCSLPNWLPTELWQLPITRQEWLNYKVLAGDQQSYWQSKLAQTIATVNQLGTPLRPLIHFPFPGKQIMKSLLRPTRPTF
uniref:Uncharacterized protein n=1 Tax=Cyanothece sp. (strain PCC 7425 / ATCC 29141) TaxID=395961 RepID=B8HPW7_CYAP4